MTKGFVILAQNTETVNYVKCAEVLAKSIRKTMPKSSISLITNDANSNNYFDSVIPFPYGDLDPKSNWKLVNDWQVYEASPYDCTIKLEADLFIPQSIEYWWDILKVNDLVVSTTIRDYKQNISKERFYRKFIDNNKLPDCYNAITYFKKSDLAEQFFKTVRLIFENWDEFKKIMQCKIDEPATTDWIYSIASAIVGPEKTTMPMFKDFSMVHMKKEINNLYSENWTDELIYEILPNTLRINTVPQRYPFHYYIKTFSEKLSKIYV